MLSQSLMVSWGRKQPSIHLQKDTIAITFVIASIRGKWHHPGLAKTNLTQFNMEHMLGMVILVRIFFLDFCLLTGINFLQSCRYVTVISIVVKNWQHFISTTIILIEVIQNKIKQTRKRNCVREWRRKWIWQNFTCFTRKYNTQKCIMNDFHNFSGTFEKEGSNGRY